MCHKWCYGTLGYVAYILNSINVVNKCAPCAPFSKSYEPYCVVVLNHASCIRFHVTRGDSARRLFGCGTVHSTIMTKETLMNLSFIPVPFGLACCTNISTMVCGLNGGLQHYIGLSGFTSHFFGAGCCLADYFSRLDR
jgi:hypothetical protein